MSIYQSFVKAQKEFGPALKQSTNPHFKSRYVDLAGCVEAVIDALNNNGIALVQKTYESDSGVIVETVFIHESGEILECGRLHVPASKHDAQGYGSALTYARRYSLMAACGIAPEDDDGNAAVKNPPKSVSKEVFDAVDDETKQWLEEIAANARKHYQKSPLEAVEYIRSQNLDPDERVALNALFDSKERAAMKKSLGEQK